MALPTLSDLHRIEAEAGVLARHADDAKRQQLEAATLLTELEKKPLFGWLFEHESHSRNYQYRSDELHKLLRGIVDELGPEILNLCAVRLVAHETRCRQGAALKLAQLHAFVSPQDGAA